MSPDLGVGEKMSELFERMKTRRASGDTKFEGIPVPAWRGGVGGVSQDLGWGIIRLVNWGVKRPYAGVCLWSMGLPLFCVFPHWFLSLAPTVFLNSLQFAENDP